MCLQKVDVKEKTKNFTYFKLHLFHQTTQIVSINLSKKELAKYPFYLTVFHKKNPAMSGIFNYRNA